MANRAHILGLGAGRMGRGIAHVFAYAGHRVSLVDIKPRTDAAFEALREEALAEIRQSLTDCAAAGLFDAGVIDTIMNRVTVVARDASDEALGQADFVFEGVPEVLDVKRDAFGFLAGRVRDDAVITSTTSTILVDTLADMVDRPERFLNAHWLNPAYIIPLVEVSPGADTGDFARDALLELLASIGKESVVCAASPGFIIPRIQALAMNEAARMVGEGVASAEDMDRAIRYGFGFRFAVLGLVEFIDWGGGDILHYASRYLTDALDAPRFEAPQVIDDNMRAGRLGLKTGSGFYDFATMDVPAYRARTLQRFVALLEHVGAARPPVLD